MITYRSENARIARIVLPASLAVLTSSLAYILRLNQEGLSLLHSTIIVAVVTIILLAVKTVNSAVIATLSETHFAFRNGFRLFSTKEVRIPLQRIHTLHIVRIPQKNRNVFKPGILTIIYRWPERKMVYATATFSVAAIPNGIDLILELARRTGAKIKVNAGETTDQNISIEEFRERLGLPALPESIEKAGNEEAEKGMGSVEAAMR